MFAPDPDAPRPLLLGLRRLCRTARLGRPAAAPPRAAPKGEGLGALLGRFFADLVKPARPAPWRADRRRVLAGLVGALTSSSALAGPAIGARQVVLGGSAAPILRAVSVPMGAWTNQGCGGVLLANMPGLHVGGARPLFWRVSGITAVGGGANTDLTNAAATFASAATARTPTPSLGTGSTLSLTLAGTSYTMQVVAVSATGRQSAPVTLTYTVVANAFNRGDNLAGADQSDRFTNLGASMNSKTMLLSVGADFGAPALFVNNHRPTATVTITNADNARPAKLTGIDVANGTFLTFDGLVLGAGNGINLITIRTNGNTVNQIIVRNFSATGRSVATIPASSQQNFNTINVSGDCTNVTVEDCTFFYVNRCISISGCATGPVLIQRNKFRYYYADGVAIGGTCGNFQIINNVFVSPMRYGGNLTGSPDHTDAWQINDGTTITSGKLSGNAWIQADGTMGLTGGQAGTGSITNFECAKNLLLFRSTNVDMRASCVSALVEDNTLMLVGSGLIAQSDVNANDNTWTGIQVLRGDGATTSTVRRNFAGGIAFGAGWTQINNVATGAAATSATQYAIATSVGVPIPTANTNYQPTPNFDGTAGTPGVGVNSTDYSSWLNYVRARELLGNYDAVANPTGTDWAALTIDQCVARAVLILTPKTGGSLDLGGGVSVGAITLAGALKAA